MSDYDKLRELHKQLHNAQESRQACEKPLEILPGMEEEWRVRLAAESEILCEIARLKTTL